MTDQEIQQYLDDNGYPPHIVAGGTAGLLRRWREFVAETEQGYPYGLHDYRNDLDLRGLIHLFDLDAEVAEADERFRDVLTATHVRVWESAPGAPFWDFGYPRNAGRWLQRDLVSAGLLAPEN
jgi:hypothetical protein